MREAAFSLAEAKFAAGDFRYNYIVIYHFLYTLNSVIISAL